MAAETSATTQTGSAGSAVAHADARVDVTVIVPVHDQAAYLPRALGSVLAQHGPSFEVVLVDDGSRDRPDDVARAMVPRDRLRIVRHLGNRGLGAACNTGLAAASGRYVAYLPADDVWFAGHLRSLVEALDARPDALAAHAELAGDRTDWLQPVQVLHRAGAVRWRERVELESDDLERTVWHELRAAGPLLATGRATCAWTDHAGGRSRLFRGTDDGGLNPFRRRYRVATPLRFEPSDADPVDERELYGLPADGRTGDATDGPTDGVTRATTQGLHVLLVGELAYNADRVLDLLPRGLRLSGLWLDDPLGFMTVGPLPFGGVTDVPREDWRGHLRADPPDVVYCLLNWRTVPLALAVAAALPDVPLVWHFKEAPQRCLARGDWPQLVALWARADAVLLCSNEERDWLLDALPGRRDPATVGVLDGDLPRGRWFAAQATDREATDAEPTGSAPTGSAPTGSAPMDGAGVHTVCVGRPIGLTPDLVAHLARAGVHLHLHGLPPDARRDWLPAAQRAAPDSVHLHPAVPPPRWRAVLGRYDAGWLHAVRHDNGGELRRATWDDLNVPARLPTLAAAGLPVLLPDSGTSISAINRVVGPAGVHFAGPDDLVDRLRDPSTMTAARAAMAAARHRFTFDAEVDRLVRTLRGVAGRPAARRSLT